MMRNITNLHMLSHSNTIVIIITTDSRDLL